MNLVTRDEPRIKFGLIVLMRSMCSTCSMWFDVFDGFDVVRCRSMCSMGSMWFDVFDEFHEFNVVRKNLSKALVACVASVPVRTKCYVSRELRFWSRENWGESKKGKGAGRGSRARDKESF